MNESFDTSDRFRTPTRRRGHVNVCVCTSVRGVERGERDDKEGRGVFPGVHQVRKGSLGVPVTPQALDEAQPGRQTLDDGAQTVRVAVAGEAPGVWKEKTGKDFKTASPRLLCRSATNPSSICVTVSDLWVVRHFPSITSCVHQLVSSLAIPVYTS